MKRKKAVKVSYEVEFRGEVTKESFGSMSDRARIFHRRTVRRRIVCRKKKLVSVRLGQIMLGSFFFFHFLRRTVLTTNCPTAKNPRAMSDIICYDLQEVKKLLFISDAIYSPSLVLEEQ